PEERGTKLAHLASRLAAAADVDRRLASYRRRAMDAMPLLPSGLFEGRAPLGHAGEEVEKRPGMVCWVEEADGRAVLRFPGGGLAAPSRTAEALRFVASAREAFHPLDLPGGLDE